MEATIEYDWEKVQRDFPPKEVENEDGTISQESTFEIPEISLEEYMKYADSQYVKGTKYYAGCRFASDTLTGVPDNVARGGEDGLV